MPDSNNKTNLVRQRRYLARDFDGFRSALLEYARKYYPDKISDFSEASLGGLFLDMAAYVGDNLSFYLDHQYNELDVETAVESQNIERHLRRAGIQIVGAAPATAPVTIFIQVPAGELGPQENSLPIIKAGSVFTSDNGIDFNLIEDVDFSKKKQDGTYVAEIKIGSKTQNGTPTSYIMAATGLCISGDIVTENIKIDREFVPFRRITLSNRNVTEIISVVDTHGNTYYEVSALTNDVIYKSVQNKNFDSTQVRDVIKVVPAPFRYTTTTDLQSRKTTLIFGGGNAETFDDDVIPDPSEFALPLPYTKTFSRVSINPYKLLQTKTLGVATTDTTLAITYRYGGGLNHNVPKDSIKSIKILKIFFPGDPPIHIASAIKNSIEVTNRIDASGGEDAPEIDELKELVPSIRNSQERIVTKEDMLARIYTLPSNFGRVFRASIKSNPTNPLAAQLYIVSRNPDGHLTTSPDTLKINLRTYLESYRMISDAIDILDAKIINLGLSFNVVINPLLNKNTVLQNILGNLQKTFNVKKFHIDQPIIISDIVNEIFVTHGVISITDVKFMNLTGRSGNRFYSDNTFDVTSNTKNNVIFPPEGGIFEIKYPEFDIVANSL